MDEMNKKLSKTQKLGDTRALLEPEHQTKKQRWGNRIIYTALILIALSVGVFLKWSFETENVLQINNEPFPVRTIREHPEANGVVILKVDVCKNVDVEGDLRISFVSREREQFLPISKERSPKGCNVTEVPIIIPETLSPGIYKVRFRTVYNINPIKTNIANEFVSREFEVSPHLVGSQQEVKE